MTRLLSMNSLFFAFVLVAFLFSGYQQLSWSPPEPAPITEAAAPADPPAPPASPMDELTNGMIKSSKDAVTLSLSLIGPMAFFLGLMRVAEKGGLLDAVSRVLRPLLTRLFPEVPPDHPAMGAIVLNLSANALGLGNAATPFGIQAMRELDTLNREKGTATNAMVLFLAINTSSVTLLPTGVIAIRGALGSADPGGITGTTLLATLASTTVAVLSAKLLSRFFGPDPGESAVPRPQEPAWAGLALLAAVFTAVPLLMLYATALTPWIVPGLAVAFLSYGVAKGVPAYEAFIEGAKEGFDTAVRIVPYLVAILVSVGMLRSSGALTAFVGLVGPWTERVGLPAEAVPMALLRPLSGSGAYGVMMEVLQKHGPDSLLGYLVSTIQGSTETTFYVLAVYFGAVGIQRTRHALVAALSADVTGIVAAVAAVHLYLSLRG